MHQKTFQRTFAISLNQPNREMVAAIWETERIAKDLFVKIDLDELFTDLKV